MSRGGGNVRDQISEHFTRSELSCKCGKCGGRLVLDFRLIDALETLRTMVNRPINVNSGYRCPLHPETTKRPGSYHAKGQAADIWVAGMSPLLLAQIAGQVPAFAAGGIASYSKDGFVHVDVGDRKWRARY